MATITGYTAARMKQIEDASIVDAHLDGYDLVLTTFAGIDINVGNVRGEQGPTGEVTNAELIAALAEFLDQADPVGVPKAWFMETPPSGYGILDGSVYDPIACPKLYALWGTTFGGTAESPLLPDLRGRTMFGFSSGDSVFGALRALTGTKDSTLVAHTHNISHEHSASSGNQSANPTAAQGTHAHAIPNHVHSMAHTHSIPALSGTAGSAGAHTHTPYNSGERFITGPSTATNLYSVAGGNPSGTTYGFLAYASDMADTTPATTTGSSGVHTHNVTTTENTTGVVSTANTGNPTSFPDTETVSAGAITISGNHTHTIKVNGLSGDSGSTGVSGVDKNVPPNMTVNWIVRLA